MRIWRLRHLLPLTPLGAALALLGVWLSHAFGAKQVDYVLRTAGLVAAGAVALALALVLLATLRVWLSVRRLHRSQADPVTLETGLTAATGLQLPGLRGWPLVQLRLLWEDPPHMELTLKRQGRKLEELATALSRNEVRHVRRRLLVEDIFGFARIGLPLVTEQYLRVNPSLARVTAHVVTRFLGGDALSHPTGPAEGELIEMRRYVYGDPLRHVLWKAFARTRKLLVRTPERAITPLPSAAAYLVAGPGDEPAASTARFFVEDGMLGLDFRFCADGAESATGDRDEALDQIVASVRHRRSGGQGLGRFLRQLTPRQLEALVLFVPSQPGRWLERVEQAAGRLKGVRAIAVVDVAPEQVRPRSVRNLLFRPPSDAGVAARRLGKVVARLGRAGFSLLVIHRPTGELLGRAQLEALTGLDARS